MHYVNLQTRSSTANFAALEYRRKHFRVEFGLGFHFVFYSNDSDFNPLTYNIESYSWYKLRSRFERKIKLQIYAISNQILNLISLN